jgi:hypothetical protein
MRRLFGVVGAMLLVMLPVSAAAQAKPADKPAPPAKTEKATPAGKTMTATGTVSAVSADSLTVKGKTDEWTFDIDSKTRVTGTGASHKTEAMKQENKPTLITDFVKVGDTVVVSFHDMGTTKHAASVRITKSALK